MLKNKNSKGSFTLGESKDKKSAKQIFTNLTTQTITNNYLSNKNSRAHSFLQPITRESCTRNQSSLDQENKENFVPSGQHHFKLPAN